MSSAKNINCNLNLLQYHLQYLQYSKNSKESKIETWGYPTRNTFNKRGLAYIIYKSMTSQIQKLRIIYRVETGI